jgi:hypothetical protein
MKRCALSRLGQIIYRGFGSGIARSLHECQLALQLDDALIGRPQTDDLFRGFLTSSFKVFTISCNLSILLRFLEGSA